MVQIKKSEHRVAQNYIFLQFLFFIKIMEQESSTRIMRIRLFNPPKQTFKLSAVEFEIYWRHVDDWWNGSVLKLNVHLDVAVFFRWDLYEEGYYSFIS